MITLVIGILIIVVLGAILFWVIDKPFLGSGSTLIAAERTGRSCRGVELDPLYIDVILRRYQAETGQSAILEATGETFGLSLS